MNPTLRALSNSSLLLVLGALCPAWAAAPDAGLFTTYNVNNNLTAAYWFLCGSTQQTEGCYSSGTLGPFGRIGAMLESHPAINGDTVTRQIFVLDLASGTGGTGVTLYVYSRQDVITESSAVSTMTLKTTIPLPQLAGGAAATASMAANNTHLYVGTNLGSQAVSVARKSWLITTIGGVGGPASVSSITADAYGFVTVTFGVGVQSSGFYVFGPNGNSPEDGGGAEFMLDTSNAVIPVPVPP
ncbi:MAG: hypothetical protein JSS29_19175 [Proteobacteria bacterium]|nr:hypothetical protein [Pseudomonadota bacterium]